MYNYYILGSIDHFLDAQASLALVMSLTHSFIIVCSTILWGYSLSETDKVMMVMMVMMVIMG